MLQEKSYADNHQVFTSSKGLTSKLWNHVSAAPGAIQMKKKVNPLKKLCAFQVGYKHVCIIWINEQNGDCRLEEPKWLKCES